MSDIEKWRKEFVDAAKALPYHVGYDGECENQGWEIMGIGPVGQHRDSDPLEKSNFKVILKDLRERFPEDVAILGFNHWAVGWTEEIGFNAKNDALVLAVAEWGGALENYPVADDDDFHETEWEENHPTENECYADSDSDCPCAAAERKRNPPPECEECGHECSPGCTECGGIPMTKEDEICGICKRNEK